jgi:aryl-alcohol dehydrogenase-like predicted oxidoreductase
MLNSQPVVEISQCTRSSTSCSSCDGETNNEELADAAAKLAWDRAPDFSVGAITASAEASLRRLDSDYIDLLQLHNAPTAVLQSDEVRTALERLLSSGKIRAWGASTKSPAEAIDALRLADVAVVQANFNMLDVRALSDGLLEEVAKHRTGFIGRTPLCFGFLSGTIKRGTVFPPGDHRNGWSRAQLDNWIEGADELLAAVGARPGAEGARSALRFCLAFPAVSSVIPGMLTPDEAAENASTSEARALPSTAVEAVLAINRNREFFVRPATGTLADVGRVMQKLALAPDERTSHTASERRPTRFPRQCRRQYAEARPPNAPLHFGYPGGNASQCWRRPPAP